MNTTPSSHTILLYYRYANVRNPQALVGWHKGFCSARNLKGRIIIAEEGINGTLEGLTADTDAYMKALRDYVDVGDFKGPVGKRGPHTPFRKIEFKISEGDGTAFRRLSVKLRNEIVSAHLGEDDVNPNRVTGNRLSAKELHELIHSGDDVAIIDMRNSYEFKVGHFANSIDPGMDNFRDLPKVLPKIEHLKDKKVVTVCTGGVRCEKASGYLKTKGFKEVYQLDGGIVSYMNAYPGNDFNGALYVFDNRIIMDTTKDRAIVGKCDICGVLTERYQNCSNNECNAKMLCCEACSDTLGHVTCIHETLVQTM